MLDIALRRFEAQTYPNKEIVVVYDQDNAAAGAVVDRHAALSSATGVRVIAAVNHKGKSATLGELRNQAIAAASGELIIQWDDDDWYSAKRVEMQYRALMASQGGDGVLLLRYTLYETLTGLIWCARLVRHAAHVVPLYHSVDYRIVQVQHPVLNRSWVYHGQASGLRIGAISAHTPLRRLGPY